MVRRRQGKGRKGMEEEAEGFFSSSERLRDRAFPQQTRWACVAFFSSFVFLFPFPPPFVRGRLRVTHSSHSLTLKISLDVLLPHSSRPHPHKLQLIAFLFLLFLYARVCVCVCLLVSVFFQLSEYPFCVLFFSPTYLLYNAF